MNGKSYTYPCDEPFALMYRRANGTFYDFINFDILRYPFIRRTRVESGK